MKLFRFEYFNEQFKNNKTIIINNDIDTSRIFSDLGKIIDGDEFKDNPEFTTKILNTLYNSFNSKPLLKPAYKVKYDWSTRDDINWIIKVIPTIEYSLLNYLFPYNITNSNSEDIQTLINTHIDIESPKDFKNIESNLIYIKIWYDYLNNETYKDIDDDEKILWDSPEDLDQFDDEILNTDIDIKNIIIDFKKIASKYTEIDFSMKFLTIVKLAKEFNDIITKLNTIKNNFYNINRPIKKEITNDIDPKTILNKAETNKYNDIIRSINNNSQTVRVMLKVESREDAAELLDCITNIKPDNTTINKKAKNFKEIYLMPIYSFKTVLEKISLDREKELKKLGINKEDYIKSRMKKFDKILSHLNDFWYITYQHNNNLKPEITKLNLTNDNFKL